MKLHPNEYNKIKQAIKNYQGLPVNCLKNLKEAFPGIPHNTLYSILIIEFQDRAKVIHYKSYLSIEKFYNAYNKEVSLGSPPGILVRMSGKESICPCIIAKWVLQKYLEDLASTGQAAPSVPTLLRDTSQIPDQDLAYEIFLCTLYDNLYSPITERLKQSLGQQYEIKLYKQVQEMGLAFRDEDHLRKFGYDKTPDVKLDVPIAIDGCVVNWIESKALFANMDVHREYTRNQYVSYYNRFGPGLVIYWFGYNEDITFIRDLRFIIRDHMPKNITHML